MDASQLLLTPLAAAAAVGVGHAAPALSAPLPFVRARLGVRDRLAAPGAVALSFDDGPHPAGTPAVLELLRERRVAATFFLVGEQVRRAPMLAAEIAAAGHTVAIHCDRHRNLLRVTPAQLKDDLDRAEDTIATAAGTLAPLYRPPYGVLSAAALRHARAHGWAVALWTRWGRDWRVAATPASIAREAADGVSAGDVVLLHDSDAYSAPGSWSRTVAALPRILDQLAAAGLEAHRITGPSCGRLLAS